MAKKLALTACMRKWLTLLNALLKSGILPHTQGRNFVEEAIQEELAVF